MLRNEARTYRGQVSQAPPRRRRALSGDGPLGIIDRRMGVIVGGIPVGHPLPDVAMHVVQAERIRFEAAHRSGEDETIAAWNRRQLANAQIARREAGVCEKLGYTMPIICTPEELMGA